MTGRAVIFDLDGTLFETADEIWRALNHVLTHAGRPGIPFEQAVGYVGQGSRVLIERGFRATGTPVDPAVLDDLVKLFISFYTDNIGSTSTPYPGVEALLETCRDHGIALGVCSNKFQVLSEKLLQKFNLADYFPVVMGPDTMGLKKPDPEFYFETLRRLGVPGARSVMVGDSETDILTARNAHVPSIGVTFGYSPHPIAEFRPDFLVHHYDEMWPILTRVFGID